MKKVSGMDEPSDAIYALVGKIALYWTYLERAVEISIWHLIGDVDLGHIFTANVHNQTLADILREAAKHRKFEPHEMEAIEHALAGFDVLRINRNALIHGMHFGEQVEGTLFFRKRKRVRIMHNFDEYVLPVERIEKLAIEMEQWGIYLNAISGTISRRRALNEARESNPNVPFASWPEKPSIPEKMTPTGK